MGARSGSETRQRDYVLRVRLDPAERERLSALAEAAGRSVAVYVREAALQQAPRSRDADRIIVALSRIGNNLNQIAKVAHRTGAVDAEPLRAALAELERVVGEL
jgi:predicted DNA-binding protein